MSSSTTPPQPSTTYSDNAEIPVLSPLPQAHLSTGRLPSSGHLVLTSYPGTHGDTPTVIRLQDADPFTLNSAQRSNAELQAMANLAVATLPPTTPPQNTRPQPQPYHSRSQLVRFMSMIGIGRNATPERKALVTVLQNATVVIIMLVLTATIFKSPLDSNLTEWVACDRPLGIWASIWVVRATLASILAFWEYQREKIRNTRRSDQENNAGAAWNPPATTPAGGNSNLNVPSSAAADLPLMTSNEPITFPYNRLYQRLTILSSLLTLTWFLTAHILVYTSINSCRRSSPHLWWLNFGILCTLYLMVVEVLILGLIVLLIAPIFIFLYNVILMCLGRHPIQRPNELKPDVPKLSKSIVDKIPLVVYIPPPDAEQDANAENHSYPPASKPLTPAPQKRSTFFRSLSSFKKSQEKGEKGTKDKKSSWEDNWEQTDYPFVTLAGNRATCAICLMDFEEPERKKAVEKDTEAEKAPHKEPTSISSEPQVDTEGAQTQVQLTETEGDLPRLEDAGEGVQPLRLLECGHVFHKTCLDPWLLDVSGRCPTCQRPVDKTKNRTQPATH
ncbi:hypothetical protein CVT24_003953 [Panaeolus cyanescens]|uniref:RING-type domain-containing protein n=1 Tax=Panaeolus cyanescens TaxID=181874 RepID=A0A409Y6I6_9AGAR|nr:hypothetical protein CVT24_003953 [Panaeolus cyanescens]